MVATLYCIAVSIHEKRQPPPKKSRSLDLDNPMPTIPEDEGEMMYHKLHV